MGSPTVTAQRPESVTRLLKELSEEVGRDKNMTVMAVSSAISDHTSRKRNSALKCWLEAISHSLAYIYSSEKTE
jgi:hypothetical protein